MEWLKNISDSVAFKLSWSRQKSIEKKQRWDELLRRYPAETLETEVSIRERQITEQVRNRFSTKKKSYDESIKKVIARQSELKRVQKILNRNYEQELQTCYERKEHIKRRHVDIKSELSGAYRKLEDAKSDIDAWHRKTKRSGLLFGNSGKKIPQHSLFGQSHGDLDAAKARKNKAAGDIGNLKNETERISAEFNRLDLEIQEIRDGQRDRREMMSQGYSNASVELENAGLSKRFKRLSLQSQAAKRRGKRVLIQELEKKSVPCDRQLALQMREQRKAELSQYMAEEQVIMRRENFRSTWNRSSCRIPDDHMVSCEKDPGASDATLSWPASAYCS